MKYADYFGIGRKTGIDIAGEADGELPSPAWKQATFGDDWRLGDTYNMGIGQGYVAATPIQMVRVTAAVANGGTLFTPRVVKQVLDPQDDRRPGRAEDCEPRTGERRQLRHHARGDGRCGGVGCATPATGLT